MSDETYELTISRELPASPEDVFDATTSTGSSPDGATMQTEITVTFEEIPTGTLMTVHQTGFPSIEMRDFFATYVMVGAFDRIEAYLVRR